MERPFFSRVEALSREEIQKLQVERLRKQMEYIFSMSPYYRRVFQEKHINPESFQALQDLQRVPFVDKYMVGESQERGPG